MYMYVDKFVKLLCYEYLLVKVLAKSILSTSYFIYAANQVYFMYIMFALRFTTSSCDIFILYIMSFALLKILPVYLIVLYFVFTI